MTKETRILISEALSKTRNRWDTFIDTGEISTDELATTRKDIEKVFSKTEGTDGFESVVSIESASSDEEGISIRAAMEKQEDGSHKLLAVQFFITLNSKGFTYNNELEPKNELEAFLIQMGAMEQVGYEQFPEATLSLTIGGDEGKIINIKSEPIAKNFPHISILKGLGSHLSMYLETRKGIENTRKIQNLIQSKEGSERVATNFIKIAKEKMWKENIVTLIPHEATRDFKNLVTSVIGHKDSLESWGGRVLGKNNLSKEDELLLTFTNDYSVMPKRHPSRMDDLDGGLKASLMMMSRDKDRKESFMEALNAKRVIGGKGEGSPDDMVLRGAPENISFIFKSLIEEVTKEPASAPSIKKLRDEEKGNDILPISPKKQ